MVELGQGTPEADATNVDDKGSWSNSDRTVISSLNDIPAVRDYLKCIGAKPVNFRTADVRSAGKYQNVLARIAFSENGEVTLVHGELELPTPLQAEAIKEAFKGLDFPHSEPCLWTGKDSPRNEPNMPWSKTDPAKLYVCWDVTGEWILFVQERVDLSNGDKFYRPWSYWSDKQWRSIEPDGKLPLHGLEQLKDHSIVCVHEGPKAALAVRALLAGPDLSGHPWGEELAHMAHLGWLGGAERSNDTDWAKLRAAGVRRVVLICDNDTVGKDVVRPISRALQLPMDAVFFDQRWPVGFDLADSFPGSLYKEVRAQPQYVGPSLTDCCKPATWATRQLSRRHDEGRRQRGQTGYEARREFAEEWYYIGSLDVFVHCRSPHRFLDTDQFNAAVRPVSDVKNTADLLHLLPSVKVEGVCYRPELPSGVVTVDGERRFNTHMPTRVNRARGNVMPFYRFMTYLIQNKLDRLNVMRFVATMIARPGVRLGYGLLLCSRAQGVGKNTLTDYILSPLIGPWNVVHPDVQRAITGAFNGWLAGKRLVVLGEMYVGHLGTKAYDTLKPLMTDKMVTVNEKFRPEYELENRAQFVGSSNSKVPLFIASTDRRWHVPEVTNKKQPQSYWRGLHCWLDGGGLEIVHQWAFDFVKVHGAVAPEDEAPASSAKAELVDASISDGRRLVHDLADYLIELGAGDKPTRVIVPLTAVKEWFSRQDHLSLSERKISERAMLEVFEEAGLNVRKRDHRIFVKAGSGRRKMTAVANFIPAPDEEWSKLAHDHLWSVSDLVKAFDFM